MARSLILDLHITAEEYLKLYEGSASEVRAYARDGRTVRFPAKILRPFVSRAGIQGSFMIYFDNNNKFVRIDRL